MLRDSARLMKCCQLDVSAFVDLSSFGARPAEAIRPLAPKDDGAMKAVGDIRSPHSALSRPAFVGPIPQGLGEICLRHPARKAGNEHRQRVEIDGLCNMELKSSRFRFTCIIGVGECG